MSGVVRITAISQVLSCEVFFYFIFFFNFTVYSNGSMNFGAHFVPYFEFAVLCVPYSVTSCRLTLIFL
jgi:hypothetical protein